jgi:hypothetical protein
VCNYVLQNMHSKQLRHHTSDKDSDHQERPFHNRTYLSTINFLTARKGGPYLTVPREPLGDRLTPSDNSQTGIPVATLWMNPIASSRRTNKDPHRIQPTHNTLHLGGALLSINLTVPPKERNPFEEMTRPDLELIIRLWGHTYKRPPRPLLSF